MPPQFYLAIGSRPRRRDVYVSQAVGQQMFLAPLGSDGARLLARTPGAIVIGDSGAYPPDNQYRITLADYATQITAWTPRPGFRFAISYDHIGDLRATERDDIALRQVLGRSHTPANLVPVAQVGQKVSDVLGDPLADLDAEELADALSYGVSFASGPVEHPVLAIGGLATWRYATAAMAWLDVFLVELQRLSWYDPSIATVHLLGVGRAEIAIRSPLIESFDSSGPVRTAGYGWGNIAPNFTEAYGLSKAKLQISREARLAYHLCQLRDRVGLPWRAADPEALLDDAPQPIAVQLDLVPV